MATSQRMYLCIKYGKNTQNACRRRFVTLCFARIIFDCFSPNSTNFIMLIRFLFNNIQYARASTMHIPTSITYLYRIHLSHHNFAIPIVSPFFSMPMKPKPCCMALQKNNSSLRSNARCCNFIFTVLTEKIPEFIFNRGNQRKRTLSKTLMLLPYHKEYCVIMIVDTLVIYLH